MAAMASIVRPPSIRALSTANIRRIGVIGGGASGMFSAIAAADSLKNIGMDQDAQVVVLESGRKTLTKVAISGGGRCNVMHDTDKPLNDILSGYPRGSKELRGLMTKRFSPAQAREWFTSRGVELKTESDGRMFPVTDNSETIIDCIENAARSCGVEILLNKRVDSIQRGEDGSFAVEVKGEADPTYFDSIILATGSAPIGFKLAQSLGHKIVKPVPSLFTLNAKHDIKEGGVLHDLSGLSVQSTRIAFKAAVEGKKKKNVLTQEGPLLITHHGISGPATLRLSAFAARELKDVNYRGKVTINWAPEFGSGNDIEALLWSMTTASPKRMVSSVCPLLTDKGSSVIPRRLWSSMVEKSGFETGSRWCDASKKKVRALARCVGEFQLEFTGKGVFKEEFVTAGGILLKEIDMKTMGSKKCPGLYCCGELINVDGVTGGYNFQNCWSTGFVSGNSAADFLASQS